MGRESEDAVVLRTFGEVPGTKEMLTGECRRPRYRSPTSRGINFGTIVPSGP